MIPSRGGSAFSLHGAAKSARTDGVTGHYTTKDPPPLYTHFWRSPAHPPPAHPARSQDTRKQRKAPESQGFRGYSAEDGGFEPPRACTQHAFQACAIGH